MARGDLINYTNHKAMAGASWMITTSSGGTYFVFAPSFEAYAYAKGSWLWGSQQAHVHVSYWNGSGWTDVLTWDNGVRGSGNSTSYTWRHMYGGGSSGDQPGIHIWRVYIASSGDGSGNVHLYAGGIELWSEDQYNSYCKGNLLRGVRIGIYASSSSIESLIASHGPAALRGTPISVSSGTYRYLCN